jgi:hypothetical protein
MTPIRPGPIAKAAPRDTYLDAVEQHRGAILAMYRLYEAERPIMLFDVNAQKIYAYPYDSFKSELTTRGQASLTKQYEEALRDGTIVVFVRDDDERKLVSYSIER